MEEVKDMGVAAAVVMAVPEDMAEIQVDQILRSCQLFDKGIAPIGINDIPSESCNHPGESAKNRF